MRLIAIYVITLSIFLASFWIASALLFALGGNMHNQWAPISAFLMSVTITAIVFWCAKTRWVSKNRESRGGE